MQCEICGKNIERGKRIRVEGSVIVACDECSSYGDVVGEIKPRMEKRISKTKEEKVSLDLGIEEELIEGYQNLIKSAREKQRMKQEELARAINEPTSLIHRIESGRVEPSIKVAKKLQKRLRIRLLKKPESIDIQLKSETPKGLTLGDLVVVKRRGRK